MNLGLFMMPVHPPGKPLYQTYEQDLQLLRLADELGFREAWIGEHGTMQWENIPAPDQFIARALPETRQIHFGTGVVLMAQHHPANTANRIAQLDHLARGRLMFGIGTGGVPTDFELFGVNGDSDEPGRRLLRAIDLILKFWTEEPPYDDPGEFWPVRLQGLRPEIGLGWLHKPYQRPHPPIALPGQGPRSHLLWTAGARGWWPMSTNFAHARVLTAHWQQVAAGAASAGRPAERRHWRIAREVLVAPTTAEARRFAREGAMGHAYREYFFRLLPAPVRQVFLADESMSPADVTIDYLLDHVWIVGDPDEVAQRLRALYEQVGGFGTLLMIAHDWDDPERWRQSMTLLAREVMPRLADLQPTP